jgi:hypothetical protein
MCDGTRTECAPALLLLALAPLFVLLGLAEVVATAGLLRLQPRQCLRLALAILGMPQLQHLLPPPEQSKDTSEWESA